LQTELNHVGGVLGRFSAQVEMINGMCELHGAAEVLVRKGAAWHCPKCLEAKMAAETDLLWVTARRADLLAAATIPAKYIEQRFIATTDPQRAVRRQAKLFSDFILKNRAWAALILVGPTGTGKTLLACELAQALMHSAARSVRYITAKGMISEIQANYGREGKSEEADIARFASYDVLVLDEIDAIPVKDNASLLLTEIVNRRYNENKPVIAISNQPFDHLARHVGERVHSRLHENSFSCALNWGDARRVRQPASAGAAA
jgi:DNA replication protein DnaC